MAGSEGAWGAVAPVWYRGESIENWTGDNFGDGPMNLFLLPRLFPRLDASRTEGSWSLLGIGSLLGIWRDLSGAAADRPLLVFGAGYQYGTARPLAAGTRVFAVRGRLSAAALDLDAETAVSDPAILLPHFLPRDREPVAGRHGHVEKWNYGVPPRIRTPKDIARVARAAWQRTRITELDEVLGGTTPGEVRFGSRTHDDLPRFVRAIWTCERVATDALHVAIAADAYRIPWRPLRWERKWADHFGMVGIDARPQDFILSDPALLAERADELLRRRDQLVEHVEST